MELSDYHALRMGSALAGTATFGGNMRREREARSLTLEELAKRLDLKRAAPLSTLETGSHVPKASTIVEYASAIGCSPADLLAGVVTEYDVLRGATSPTASVTADTPALTLTEKRALRLLARMSDEGQRLAVSRLAGLVAAFPREPLQESSIRAREKPAATGRKGHGRR